MFRPDQIAIILKHLARRRAASAGDPAGGATEAGRPDALAKGAKPDTEAAPIHSGPGGATLPHPMARNMRANRSRATRVSSRPRSRPSRE